MPKAKKGTPARGATSKDRRAKKTPPSAVEAPTREDFLSFRELAALLEVGERTLSSWVGADTDFPDPSPTSSPSRRWSKPAVLEYRSTLVTIEEVAAILGVSVTTVGNLRRSDSGFPDPVLPPTNRVTPLWRRRQVDDFAAKRRQSGRSVPVKDRGIPAVTFAQFAQLMGVGTPALHAQKTNDRHFPPALTDGRGAVWARVDAETYRDWRRGDRVDPPQWRKHREPDLDLVTLAEFAEIVGLSPTTVAIYKSNREPGFPPPALDSRYPVWTRSDARAYARARSASPRKGRATGATR